MRGRALHAADRLQPRPGVDLGLRHHRRLAPEALDDRAGEGADIGRRHQHRHLALARGVLEAVAHGGDELLQPGGLHGEGWPLGRSIQERELEVVVSRVSGVDGVTGLRMFLRDQAGPRWRELLGSDAQPASLSLEPWQLPELLAVVVASGAPSAVLDPQPLAGDRQGIAVPVMPEVC